MEIRTSHIRIRALLCIEQTATSRTTQRTRHANSHERDEPNKRDLDHRRAVVPQPDPAPVPVRIRPRAIGFRLRRHRSQEGGW